MVKNMIVAKHYSGKTPKGGAEVLAEAGLIPANPIDTITVLRAGRRFDSISVLMVLRAGRRCRSQEQEAEDVKHV